MQTRQNRKKLQQLRIIGGQWRGRKLHFPNLPGLRPTPDRVRETLFNWLAPHLPGARCMDLFAGSGALGIEALSRGAGYVVFVEHNAQACQQLSENLAKLQVNHADVAHTQAQAWLEYTQTIPFDIVLLDPPFAADILQVICSQLEASQLCLPNALIYLETQRHTLLQLPANWTLQRDKIAGQVRYMLVRRQVNNG